MLFYMEKTDLMLDRSEAGSGGWCHDDGACFRISSLPRQVVQLDGWHGKEIIKGQEPRCV